jgi:uncharacterized protein
MKIGVLSDTHGHLPGTVLRAFEGVDHILHCGDVGDSSLLDELELVAPVSAVHGNVDYAGDPARMPLTRVERLGGIVIGVTHGHQFADAAGRTHALALSFHDDHPQLICYGHTHRFAEDWVGGVLTLNPGSVIRPRGAFGPTVAIVTVDRGSLLVRRVGLGNEK